MYIALKPVRFDREYLIGELIPEKVVDPKMEATLIKRGRIAKVEGSANTETPVIPEPTTTVTPNDGEGGTPDGENGTSDGEGGTPDGTEGETSDGVEGGSETDGDPDPEVTGTESAETVNLDDMKKDELLKHATDMGLEANERMTKAEIKELILKAQQGGEANE